MAGRYDRVGGVWNKVSKRSDRVSAVFQPVKKRYVKAGGVWQPSYSSGIPATYAGEYSTSNKINWSTDHSMTFLTDANNLSWSTTINAPTSSNMEGRNGLSFQIPNTSPVTQDGMPLIRFAGNITISGIDGYGSCGSLQMDFLAYNGGNLMTTGAGHSIYDSNFGNGTYYVDVTATMGTFGLTATPTSYVIRVSAYFNVASNKGRTISVSIPWSNFTFIPLDTGLNYG